MKLHQANPDERIVLHLDLLARLVTIHALSKCLHEPTGDTATMSTIQTKRRHRRNPVVRGGPLSITPQDVAVFRLLTRYRYLDSHLLWRLLPHEVKGTPQLERRVANRKSKVESAETHFKKRLLRLTTWGYIHRSLDDHLSGDMAYFGNEIYELWDEGALYLSELGLDDENITGLRAGNERHFAHALMICSALASIELGVRATPGVRFITGHEILSHAPVETRTSDDPWLLPEAEISYRFGAHRAAVSKRIRLRPDSPLFGFEYACEPQPRVRFALLEVENKNRITCGNLDQNSWLRKVLAYKRLREEKLISQKYNIPNLFVYAIGPSRKHTENMQHVVEEVYGSMGSNMFLFTAMPSFGQRYNKMPAPALDLFTRPLQTAGHGDFYMNSTDGKTPAQGSPPYLLHPSIAVAA